jgi:Domain of unknown function (DUF4129)
VPRTARPGPRGSSLSRQAWLTVLVATLVFLVALGSRRSFANVSPSRTLLDARVVLGDLFVILGAVLVAEFCLLIYVWVTHLRKRRSGVDEDEERIPSSWGQRLLASLAALMLFAVLIGVVARNEGSGSSTPLGVTPPVGLPALGSDQPAGQTFVAHWWILVGLALVGLAGLLLTVLLRRHRRRLEVEAESAPPEREELLAAVEASLEKLKEDLDPRKAVIGAYVSMEQALSRHGLARRSSEAPLEYLARWTNAIRVSRSPAEALTRLYERARFSLHLIDEDMMQEATAALLTLRHELGEKMG